jgi:hypothetical protein
MGKITLTDEPCQTLPEDRLLMVCRARVLGLSEKLPER